MIAMADCGLGIGEESGMREVNTETSPKPIEWKDLTDFVDKPVYEGNTCKWYILHGYKQYGSNKEVYLSDEKGAKSFVEISLFPTDKGIVKTIPSPFMTHK